MKTFNDTMQKLNTTIAQGQQDRSNAAVGFGGQVEVDANGNVN
jgi:hypothetical protein